MHLTQLYTFCTSERSAPVASYPVNVPALRWRTLENGPNTPVQLSSTAGWASPGFGEFVRSYDGTGKFMGRFHHPERGLAVWPTPCGGQLQVSPNDLVRSQSTSVASALAGIDHRQLTTGADSNTPDITLTVTLDDLTVCYDARGTYDVDARVTVESDDVAFEGLTSLRGHVSEREDVLASWEDVCGDVSSSTAWSKRLEDLVGGGDICVDGEIRKTKQGVETALEVSTAKLNADGSHIGWSYGE